MVKHYLSARRPVSLLFFRLNAITLWLVGAFCLVLAFSPVWAQTPGGAFINPSLTDSVRQPVVRPGNQPARIRGLKPERFRFTLTGRLTDQVTGESLPFASLQIRGSRVSGQTNVDGYFTLLNVPSDTATVWVSHVGYRNTAFSLTPKTPLRNVQIEVAPSEQQLDEVTVIGERTEVISMNEEIGMIRMTPRNLAKLPNVGERDPFRAFQLMPGVSASNESSSGLYVRGGTPDQTLVLYDGFTVYHVDHLFGFFSAFNYNAIKDIKLYKGGFDAKFGGRISAVAEITGKEGNKKRFNVGGDLSMLSANAYVEAPLGKKISLLLAGRRSWKGPLYNTIFNKFTAERQTAAAQQQQGPGGGRQRPGANASTTTQTAASYFYDLNAKVTLTPTSRDILTWSLYNGTDNMDNSSSSAFSFGRGGQQSASINTNDLSNWGNIGSSFKWSHRWSDKLYSNALISYSDYYSQRDNSRTVTTVFSTTATSGPTPRNLNVGTSETNHLRDLTAKIDFEYKLASTHQVDFGLQFTQNEIQYDYFQNDTISVLSKRDLGLVSTAYVQDQIRLMDGQLTVKPGLRLNHFGLTGKLYAEPRLSVNYLLSPQLKLKATVGRYYQFAKQINREDLTQGNRNYWLLANGTSLPVTQSDHLIAGGSYEQHGFLVDVEFYQKQNRGITEYTLRFVPQIRQGLAARETFFNGDETVRGVDVLVQKKAGNLTGWVGYTLAGAVRKVSAFSDQPYYSDQDVRHQIKVAALYHHKRFDLSLTQIYATGRPYTSILGAYGVTLLDGSQRDFTMPSDKNANRLPAYHRMDASATYSFRWGSIGVSVFNVYNRQNVWYKRFQVVRENGETALQTTSVTYLGITPNLTLSAKLH